MTDVGTLPPAAQPPGGGLVLPPGWGAAAASGFSFLGFAGYVFLIVYSALAPIEYWRPTTIAYDPACAAGCEPFRAVAPAHNVAAAEAVAVPMLAFNPNVDDAIAQWGDCLESIIECVRQQPRNAALNVNGCVRLSVCRGGAFATTSR
jgi:hypothetical protein